MATVIMILGLALFVLSLYLESKTQNLQLNILARRVSAQDELLDLLLAKLRDVD